MRDLRGGLVRTSLALAVGALALTGCSEKQEASTTLPTPSATETTPELPPLGPADFPVPQEARAETPDGAVEFVRYYVALTKHLALNSADPTPLVDLSQDCRTCIRIAQSFEADLAAQYSYRDYEYEFDEYGPALINGDTAEVGFAYVQGPITAVDPAGQVVPDRSAATPQELRSGATLLWKDDVQSWVMTGLTVG
ncbi:DUF6318 family protein [Blastococcus xanthinilyticus]|uniref:Lipoprotein n=1 Tax=Blastococcus xanthinilyticus TaxID=1564164 RepID=A0A5S5D4H2_9ACTN|nr:DUF6318 family protein [Blastococcus xanthinilyticus]TYP90831.1 hypothetical protein BD833_101550 [Blastococcus xanthinilyticus]